MEFQSFFFSQVQDFLFFFVSFQNLPLLLPFLLLCSVTDLSTSPLRFNLSTTPPPWKVHSFLALFILLKFCLVAKNQIIFFCLNVVWLSRKQDEIKTELLLLLFFLGDIYAFLFWLNSYLLPRKWRNENRMNIFQLNW